MSSRSEVKVAGPLAAYAVGFALELRRRGYADLTVAGHLRLMAHVSRWLAGQSLDAAGLTPGRIEEFAAARRAGNARRSTARTWPTRGARSAPVTRPGPPPGR